MFHRKTQALIAFVVHSSPLILLNSAHELQQGALACVGSRSVPCQTCPCQTFWRSVQRNSWLVSWAQTLIGSCACRHAMHEPCPAIDILSGTIRDNLVYAECLSPGEVLVSTGA